MDWCKHMQTKIALSCMYCYCWTVHDECHCNLVACVGSHPCSWESLLREGSVSLKDHEYSPESLEWSCRSCNNQCVGHQSSPSWVLLEDVVFPIILLESWTWSMWVHALKICKMVKSMIYLLQSLDLVSWRASMLWGTAIQCNVVSMGQDLWLVIEASIGLEWDHCELTPVVITTVPGVVI